MFRVGSRALILQCVCRSTRALYSHNATHRCLKMPSLEQVYGGSGAQLLIYHGTENRKFVEDIVRWEKRL